MSDEVISAILTEEAKRCGALIEADFAVLAELMSDDLVHVHATGGVDDKTSYLAGIEEKLEFLEASRPETQVRVFGPIAIASGPLLQRIRITQQDIVVEMKAFATLVWRFEGDKWRVCSFQATNVAS